MTVPVLWGRASSVNVQKVMWALAECHVPHERRDAGWTYGQTDTEAFRAMAPLGRVPVWQEGDFALWESHVILRHLARGPCAALWPEDRLARAEADLWMEFTTTTLLPALLGVFHQKVRMTESERSEAAIARHLKGLEAALDILEARLEGRDWLLGNALTLADITAGVGMFRYHDMDIPRRDRPAILAWYDRMRARPAYQGSAMTSYDELRAV